VAHSLRLSLLGIVAFGVVCFHAWQTERELKQERDLHAVDHITAKGCTRCHAEHARSFEPTFHRTMTQAASDESVRGDFRDQTLDYFGVSARMWRAANGDFLVEYGTESWGRQTYRVVKTVGSRRYQQYIAERGEELIRLPVAFNLEEKRWFHMNGAFLTADPDSTPLSQSDYERHVTRWNDNCVFCHNVAPNPGLVANSKASRRFDTQVAEHGIACEACHGPGEEHATLNTSPLRRYRLHASETQDPSIVNPANLSPARSADLCGRCHGQRITDDVDAFLKHGDPFVPGEDLALYSAPLWRDTTLGGEPGAFAARFWPDGTPRLTAYEYQGMLLSACSARGDLTCTGCHGMHSGDPKGQIRPEKHGHAMCTDCHRDLTDEKSQARHARHDLRDGSPTCADCHMPKIVYGVLDAHPSHRISIPDPARAARFTEPDACTLCHVERTRRWAAEHRARLWQKELGDLPPATAWPEAEMRLFAGDPIERVLSAHALGESGRARGARTKHQTALLLEVMQHDPYPAVRRFARNALIDLAPELSETLRRFVPEATAEARASFLSQALFQRGQVSMDLALLNRLRAEAAQVAIEIGE